MCDDSIRECGFAREDGEPSCEHLDIAGVVTDAWKYVFRTTM
jgi:hypothetical protein